MDMYRRYDSDEAKAKAYSHRLDQAEEKMKSFEAKAEKYFGRYENRPLSTQETPNGHRINTPEGTSIIDALYSSLTATEVDILVASVGQGTDDQEYLATAALAKEWDVTDVQQRANKAIKDSLITGIGWVKVGYEYYESEEEMPKADSELQEELARAIVGAGYSEDADYEGPSIGDLQAAIPLTHVTRTVERDRVVIDYVPWDKLLYDPDAKQVEDISWVAQKTLMHPDEVRQNPLFRAYCAKNRQTRKLDDVKGDTQVDFSILKGSRKVDNEDQRVTVYEVHDLRGGTVCTLIKGQDWLLNETPGLFAFEDDLPNRSPFVPLNMRVTPRRVRGISEFEVLEPTLKELDLYHSLLATYLERQAPKYQGEAGALTQAGQAALKSQEYGAVVEREVGKEPLATLDPPQLMSEMYAMIDKLVDAAREASGVNELMRGVFPDRKRTATETAEVVSASTARQAEKNMQLTEFYRGIGRRMLSLMQMFYTAERVARYADVEAGSFEWKWTADDLAFESKLEIELTPREAKTWQSRRDDATAVLNVAGPLAQPGQDGSSVIVPDALMEYVFTEMGVSRRWQNKLISSKAEQQQQQLAQQQAMAAQASAGAGVPRPDMTSGPLEAQAVAGAVNQGTVPDELLAAAGGGPFVAEGTEAISESRGLALPTG